MTLSPRPLLAAATLAALVTPTLALAQHACESSQTQSCPEGQRYDATTRSCMPMPTS